MTQSAAGEPQVQAPTRAVRKKGPIRLLIGGEWAPVVDGRTFATLNRANGQLLVEVALAGKEELDRAVLADHRAVEGAWSEKTVWVGL